MTPAMVRRIWIKRYLNLGYIEVIVVLDNFVRWMAALYSGHKLTSGSRLPSRSKHEYIVGHY
jgi:hypothetical protein